MSAEEAAGGGFDVGGLGDEGLLQVLGVGHRGVGGTDSLHRPLEVGQQLLVDARRQLGTEAAANTAAVISIVTGTNSAAVAPRCWADMTQASDSPSVSMPPK